MSSAYFIKQLCNRTMLQFAFFMSAAVLLVSCDSKPNETKSIAENTTSTSPLFELVPRKQSKVMFNNVIPKETPTLNVVIYQYLHNGTGVSLGDINNDGLVDLYFTMNFGHNRMYLNKGNLEFEDITKRAGVEGARGWTTGTTMVDINNDGYLDIYVSRSGKMDPDKRRNELFINNKDNTFTESAASFGLDDPANSTQAAFLDYDRDGDLDMYLVNHPIDPLPGKAFEIAVKERNPNTSDKLYRNDAGSFVDVSKESGLVDNAIGYGLSASIGDLNNDGWPDIYVSNDYVEHDYLYMNNKDGTFSEELKNRTRHISNFSMGSDIGDFNQDGLLDIMVVDMVAADNYRIKTNMSGMSTEAFYKSLEDGYHYQYMMNTLQMNNGNGTFSEVSKINGLSSTDWSWAPLWADFDNDGKEDLFITNGLRKDARNNDFVNKKKKILEKFSKDKSRGWEYIQQILGEMPENPIQNYVFKNEGDMSFSNQSDAWGITEKTYSNGAAYADLDNDGDLDMVVSNLDQPVFIYKNTTSETSKNSYLNIKLQGSKSNLSGLGTRVTLKNKDAYQVKEHYLQRGYLSSVEDELHFGLGALTKVDSLWITWSDGKQQLLTNIKPNQTLVVKYDDAPSESIAGIYKPNHGVSLKEVTSQVGVGFKHQENEYNDFDRESLLPHKLSTMGPGMAVADVNGDGLDDFFIGAAKGFTGALYLQTDRETFVKSSSKPWTKDEESEDVAATFFDAEGDGDQDLYVVSGGNEMAMDAAVLQDRLYLNDGKGNFSLSRDALPEMLTSGSVVSAADYDQDGDQDLFVGGRSVPGKYPVAPRSYLLQNDNGTFTDVTEQVMPDAMKPGMITSALWTDYNNDQKLDLVLAGEWMPITVLKNTGSNFESQTEILGLGETDGWWYSVASGDFDGDGDEDYLMGNLGQNYKYQATAEAPFEIYYDDFDDNDQGDIVLSYSEDGKAVPLRGRQCSSEQMPFIKEKFTTYDAFAKADMNDIFGAEKLSQALHLQAKTFQSVYLENNGDQPWKVRPLPKLAQTSSVNGFVVKDINQDGHLDAVLAGNLYGSEVETPRNDAGNGLILLGDGKGSFVAKSANETGFFAPFDAKEIHMLRGGETNFIAVVNNSNLLQIFQINSDVQISL